MHIKTENYEWAHGRKPRGRGQWAFSVTTIPGGTTELFFNGTYSECCKKAKAAALKMDGFPSSITVLS